MAVEEGAGRECAQSPRVSLTKAEMRQVRRVSGEEDGEKREYGGETEALSVGSSGLHHLSGSEVAPSALCLSVGRLPPPPLHI